MTKLEKEISDILLDNMNESGAIDNYKEVARDIIALIKNLVPDEQKTEISRTRHWCYRAIGWNELRAEILRRIEEEG